MTALTAALCVAGAVTGSLLNALIYRAPRGIPMARGRSFCPSCRHTLGARDLVPVASWLWRRGRCRFCGRPIGLRYLLVELVCVLLFAAIGRQSGPLADRLLLAAVAACLVGVACTDWLHLLIPDRYGVALALCGLLRLALSDNPAALLPDRLLGMVSVSGVFLLIALASRGRAIGGGDVKLMAALGLCLGWQLTLLTALLGSLFGTAALVLLRPTRYALGREVPYGAFLSAGGLAAILYGERLLAWYLGLLTGG